MRVTITKAGQEDYLPVYSLVRNELGYDEIDYDKFCNRMELMDSNDKYSTIVAKADGIVVGFIGLQRGIAYNVDGEYLQISAMAVSGDLQNRGIGTQLISYAEEYAKLHKIHRIVLTSRLHRTSAHSFYEARGYTIKSYGYKKDV